MRILCPMLFLAWMVFLYKREDDVKHVNKYALYGLTYLLLVLSIIWNKESGVVCLIGYLAFSFSKGLAVCFRKEKYKIAGT